MPETIATRPDFAALLRTEVDRILSDPAFRRSPVQSRLLAYLCEQTIAGSRAPSQFGIAVDGLGRDEDYDLVSESYPRVQISRLRQNLAEYYSRVQPGEGLCVFVRRGDYKLRLLPYEKAYPRNPTRPAEPAPPEPDPPFIVTPPSSRRRYTPAFAIGGLALLLVIVAAAAWLLRDNPDPAEGDPLAASPAVGLEVTGAATQVADGDQADLAGAVRRLAQAQIAGSFIAHPPAPGEPASSAPFQLKISLGEGIDGQPEADMVLVDTAGTALFTDNLVYDGNRSRFLSRASASLSSVLRPNGVVARALIADIREPTQSDFACQLSIEAIRADGLSNRELIDPCLQRFPDSGFVPYWEAQKAAMLFQERLAAGQPIVRSGPAWELLRDVFERDAHNTYGNVLMAKLEFVAGRCDLANRFGAQGLARGGYFPALYAMHVSERAGCPIDERETAEIRETLRALVEANPSPDPLMRFHLLLASEAVGLHDVAAQVCATTTLEPDTSRIGRLSDAICRAKADPAFLRARRDLLARQLGLTLWSDGARRNFMRQLTARQARANPRP